jgi:hypothetical protein
MRHTGVIGLCLSALVLTALLWGALRAPQHAAGLQAFQRLPDHDYLADITALEHQDRLAEALALSQFVCEQPTYPQRDDACRLAAQLREHIDSVWYRARRVGWGALSGNATDGWGLVGAATADFFVVGDVRDLLIQSWYVTQGHEVDELLVLLSGIGVLTVAVPAVDWVPAFGKAAVRLGAFSKRFTVVLVHLGRRAVTTRKLAPVRDVLENVGETVRRLGPAKTLGVLPLVESTDDLARLAHLAARQPQQTYSLLKVGGKQALELATGGASSADMVRAARKGAPGLTLLQHYGTRMFTSHLLVGASKALYRGRVSQAMSWWLATHPPAVRGVTTVALAGAWLLNLSLLGSMLKRRWGRRGL